MYVSQMHVTPWVLRTQQPEVCFICAFVQPKIWPLVACSKCWLD